CKTMEAVELLGGDECSLVAQSVKWRSRIWVVVVMREEGNW
ncbi:hypothetical protein A2U01_0088928, partial [Trifolium medium]|nr:hypothetical protein [Trifolium medium]